MTKVQTRHQRENSTPESHGLNLYYITGPSISTMVQQKIYENVKIYLKGFLRDFEMKCRPQALKRNTKNMVKYRNHP